VRDEEEVVLVENASSGVNGLLRSLPLKKGDRVLVFNTAYGMVKHTLEVQGLLRWKAGQRG
jgi:selenocysteine lyase/cysteine desulfurase